MGHIAQRMHGKNVPKGLDNSGNIEGFFIFPVPEVPVP
jgi:hypothetical protein